MDGWMDGWLNGYEWKRKMPHPLHHQGHCLGFVQSIHTYIHTFIHTVYIKIKMSTSEIQPIQSEGWWKVKLNGDLHGSTIRIYIFYLVYGIYVYSMYIHVSWYDGHIVMKELHKELSSNRRNVGFITDTCKGRIYL